MRWEHQDQYARVREKELSSRGEDGEEPIGDDGERRGEWDVWLWHTGGACGKRSVWMKVKGVANCDFATFNVVGTVPRVGLCLQTEKNHNPNKPLNNG